MTLAVNIAQGASNNVTFRNRIINGGMVIDQRNAGASVTGNNTVFSVDRWKVGATQSSKFTMQQVTDAPAGFKNSLKITSSSAYSVTSTDEFEMFQPIEGYNIADLNWGTANAVSVTLSFQTKSSLTGTFGGVLYNNATNRSYIFSYTINSANTWESKSVTIAGDTTGTWETGTGFGIGVLFCIGAGSTLLSTAGSWGSTFYRGPTGQVSVVGTNGATWYVTGVQLEAGTTASPFEYRQYTTELQLCQRYYERSYDIGTTTGTFGNGWSGFSTGTNSTGETTPNIIFKVTKRASPTITGYNAVSGAANAVYRVSDAASIGISYFNYIGTNQVGLINLASGMSNAYYVSWTASAEL